MRQARWFAASAVAALAAAGLASATPAPVPAADPVGSVSATPTPAPPAQRAEPAEEPVPETSTTETATPTTAPTTVVPTSRTADGRMPVGTPMPALADPLPRPRLQVAVVQALDKVTAESIRFAVPVGQQRRWRGLIFRARACETTASDEPLRDAAAYLEIYSQPRARDGAVDPRRIFQGWMFASAPGVNALQHPLYDAWVISCQAEAPPNA